MATIVLKNEFFKIFNVKITLKFLLDYFIMVTMRDAINLSFASGLKMAEDF